jgi:hypothetical protein
MKTSRAESFSRSGGWSATGSLFTFNPTRRVTLQANFPNSEDYTVQFNVDYPPIPAPPPGWNPITTEATIVWSVEGNSVRRRVSVCNGVSVTGVGQACRVEIMDTTIQLAGAGAPKNVEYPVSVQVAPGTRAPIQQPPTLSRLTSPNGYIVVPAGTFTIVPIPQDAGAVSVYVAVRITPSLPVVPEGQALVSQELPGIIVRSYDARTFEWVPLAPGATQIRFDNFTAAQTMSISVVFGIDG